MADTDIIFKREATFLATVTYAPDPGGLPNLIGCTVTSSILDSGRNRYPLTVTLAGDGLSFTCEADSANTATWDTGDAQWDIRFEIGGIVFYSQTIMLTVASQVTL